MTARANGRGNGRRRSQDEGASCTNPRHHHIIDYVKREVICKQCGGIVLDDESNELRARVSGRDELMAMGSGRSVQNSSFITRLGEEHRYISPGQPGKCHTLANPYGCRDFEGNRCPPVLTPFEGQKAGKFIGMNGKWNDDGTFSAAYERDKWYIESNNEMLNIARAYGISQETVMMLSDDVLKGYSRYVISILARLVPRLKIHHVPRSRITKAHREENRKIVMQLIGRLAKSLAEEVELGDAMDAEPEAAVEEPRQKVVLKKLGGGLKRRR